MNDDENKPGVTQIPLIHDLVFDPSQPLKPPRKPPSYIAPNTPRHFPPGYDPDTADLFEDIMEPLNPADEVDDFAMQDQGPETARDNGFNEELRAELSDELSLILKHLDHPES